MSSLGAEDLSPYSNPSIRFDFDAPNWEVIADTILTPYVESSKVYKSAYYQKQFQNKLARFNSINTAKYKMAFCRQKSIKLAKVNKVEEFLKSRQKAIKIEDNAFQTHRNKTENLQFEEEIYISQDTFHMPNIRPFTSNKKLKSLNSLLSIRNKAQKNEEAFEYRKEIILPIDIAHALAKPALLDIMKRKGSVAALSK